jgi:hypothetical protein
MDVFGSRRVLLAFATAAITALGGLGALSASASAREHEHPTVTPYGPSGLDEPRGLAFGPGGRLYVAESGHGGSECPSNHEEEEGARCVGFTSAINSIDAHDGHRVLSGLVSLAGKEGFGAEGMEGVSFDNDGGLFATVGTNAHEIPSPAPYLSTQTIEAAKAQLGLLIHLRPDRHSQSSGQFETVADVGDFGFQWATEHFEELNPEQPPDSNPYGIYAGPHERFVADAAANTVDEVRQNGSVSVIAYIPNPPHSDAVPTCIDRGRDGALYVGELTGVENAPGASIVWRVVEGQPPEEWARGLTAVTGCGFGPDGKFYATEFSTLGFESFTEGTGALVRVPPHSTAPIPIISNTPEQTDSPLSFPNGFAARDGAIYVSNWSVAPASTGLGQVVRIKTH